MTIPTQTQRHPFLDDLTENVVLSSSILRRQVKGRDKVLQVVKAGASQYAAQKPSFLGDVGERTYFEYDITLHDGSQGTGLVSIRRNAEREVVGLEVCFSPLSVVLAMAAGVREHLAHAFDSELFL